MRPITGRKRWRKPTCASPATKIVGPRLEAKDYLAQDNPVGLPLAARMRRGRGLTGGLLGLTVLRKLVDRPLSDEGLLVIWDFVRSQVKLTDEEETMVNETIEREQKKGGRQRLTGSQQVRLMGLVEERWTSRSSAAE